MSDMKDMDTSLSRPETIDDLDLTVRAYNCLKREGIHSVDELLRRSVENLLEIRNLGMKEIEGIEARLARYDLHLGSERAEALNEELLRGAPWFSHYPQVVGSVEIAVEDVTVYRHGAVQLVVRGDGSGTVSQTNFSPTEMAALFAMAAQADAKRQENVDEQG